MYAEPGLLARTIASFFAANPVLGMWCDAFGPLAVALALLAFYGWALRRMDCETTK